MGTDPLLSKSDRDRLRGPMDTTPDPPERTEMTTYRMADGSLVWGEYAFVHDPEFFEDGDLVEVVVETWERVGRRVEMHGPSPLCESCEGDGYVLPPADEAGIDPPVEEQCPACGGSGDGRETPYVVEEARGG